MTTIMSVKDHNIVHEKTLFGRRIPLWSNNSRNFGEDEEEKQKLREIGLYFEAFENNTQWASRALL